MANYGPATVEYDLDSADGALRRITRAVRNAPALTRRNAVVKSGPFDASADEYGYLGRHGFDEFTLECEDDDAALAASPSHSGIARVVPFDASYGAGTGSRTFRWTFKTGGTVSVECLITSVALVPATDDLTVRRITLQPTGEATVTGL